MFGVCGGYAGRRGGYVGSEILFRFMCDLFFFSLSLCSHPLLLSDSNNDKHKVQIRPVKPHQYKSVETVFSSVTRRYSKYSHKSLKKTKTNSFPPFLSILHTPSSLHQDKPWKRGLPLSHSLTVNLTAANRFFPNGHGCARCDVK